MAYLVNVTWGLPLLLGIALRDGATAVLGIVLEKIMWAPMRAKRAGLAAAAADVDRARLRDPLR